MARYKAGITQAELARRAGVPASMVSAYEGGRRQPTLPTLLRLLKAAGYELRMHLAPYDDHDDVLVEHRQRWPRHDQAAWEEFQRSRLEDDRSLLEAVHGKPEARRGP